MQKISPKVFLFDMDGVIFDSMPAHARSWHLAFKDEGVEFSEYEVYLQEGATGSKTVNDVFMAQKGRVATQEEISRIYARKCRNFEQCGEPKPMPVMDKVLNLLLTNGKTVGLVTGSGQKSLFTTLNKYYPGIFLPERMVTAFDVKKGKPDPEPYLMGLQKCGVSAGEAVVVENAPMGVQAAKAAGIFTIAVNTGILDRQCLIDAGADVVLDSVTALLEFLAKSI
ncbi:MAG: HAD-IA family hydrolase [Paludibacteraceae bacterium]|nr:HAD-IA family hydrolase [Paludibacteraceae bacterium]